jgi:4-cresol dehydrogenase (hydroxylating)
MSDVVLDAMAAIVGAGNAHGSGSDAFAAGAARFAMIAGAAPRYAALVQPGDSKELAAVVAEARSRKLGLLLSYNGSDVGARLIGDHDSLILDLSRMNRILEVDPVNACARVEPGVSFADLAAHLAREGHPLLVDSERDPAGSLVGSIFAKGIGHTPYADHALMQCGGEFVLPDGSLVRTGMGAMPESPTWPLYKFSLGPYADGLAIQSGAVIPTQVGIWLMGKPPAQRLFAFDIAGEADIAGVLEALRPLKINNLLAGTITITHQAFDKARASTAGGRGAWRLFGACYGLPRLVELGMAAVNGTLAGIEGVRAVDDTALGRDPVWREQAALMAGGVGESAPRFTGGGGDAAARITFVAAIEGAAAPGMMAVAQAVTRAHELPLLAEFALCGRSLFQTVHLPYKRGQAPGFARVAACAGQLIDQMGTAGFGLASESFELSRLADEALGTGPLHTLQDRVLAAVGGATA